MATSAAAKNLMLDALGAAITHIGLANSGVELSGGAPAYARQPVAFGAAAAGVLTMTGTETFDVEGGDTVNQVILRSALTAGIDYGFDDVTQEVFGGQGTYQVTALTITLADA